MTARHWATFGEFVRNQGRHNGQQLLDPVLLAECFKPTQPQNPAYGLTWWLKQPVSDALIQANPTLKEIAALANAAWVPADLVMAAGAGKQRLYVTLFRRSTWSLSDRVDCRRDSRMLRLSVYCCGKKKRQNSA